MTDIPDNLLTILERENQAAVGYLSDEVSTDQDDSLDRYLGRPYGDEEEGSSNALSMDVAEVVDWALPDLLEPFLSGGRVADFEPETQEAEPHCDAAADYLDYVFNKDNPGTIILHDTAKTAFIQKLGVTKLIWNDEPKVTEEDMRGLPLMLVNEISQDEGIEIVEQSARPIQPGDVSEEHAAAFEDGQVYDIKIERTKPGGKLQIAVVPPEEFKVTARSSDLETVSYVCHEVHKTRSELINEMGFDEALVMGAAGQDADEDTRRDTRFYNETENGENGESKLSDEVILIEEYLRHDGKILQVFRVGRTILQDPEHVDEHPFNCWTADRIPSRLIGLGIADKVKQTQRIKTVLMRQSLDNLYLHNNPRIEVPDDAITDDTYDDLLTYRIGGLVRTKKPDMLKPMVVPNTSGASLNALTYMDQVREQQSGIVKNGMAISSEVLDPKSATESRRQDRNEQSRKRLMARMFGETFVAPLWAKMLRMIIRHQDFARQIKVRDDWVAVDPRSWVSDMRCRVAVGLGHTNRDEMLQGAQMVLGMQREAIAMGMASPKHLFKTAEKVIEGVGFQFADQFFFDPETEDGQQALAAFAEQQQSQANPELQMEAQRFQFEQQKSAAEHKLKADEAQYKMQVMEFEAQTKVQLAEIQAANNFKIAQMKMAAEAELKREQMAIEAQLKAQQMMMDPATMNGSAGSDVRFGGATG